MANSAPSGPSDYNTKIIEEFRANGGHVGGPWAGITLILVHHIGAKSGIERVSPLAYSLQGDGHFAIWAANGGSPGHPNWYYNLKADPRIKAEVDTQTFTVLAQELDDCPRRAVAEAARAVSATQRSPGQDHATDSGVHADPPGLTCELIAATIRQRVSAGPPTLPSIIPGLAHLAVIAGISCPPRTPDCRGAPCRDQRPGSSGCGVWRDGVPAGRAAAWPGF